MSKIIDTREKKEEIFKNGKERGVRDIGRQGVRRRRLVK